MDTLARHITQELNRRACCVVFESDLERCWPSGKIEPTERGRKIQGFAESQGWTAVILAVEFGARAIFWEAKKAPRHFQVVSPNKKEIG